MSWHPPETEIHRPVNKKNGRKKADKGEPSGDRRIMHVDMDAFFAAVEQRDVPQLKGKPVIVGGIPGQRGVVSTCSYEAREYGVRSGMPIAEAEKLCPHAEFLKTHGSKYTHASEKIIRTFFLFSPLVEPVSIDEAYLDVTGSVKLYGEEYSLGRALKEKIYRNTKLTCSVGIAPTRVLAKLASGLDKPDGLTVIKKDEIQEKVYSLKVEKLWGVGEKTMMSLNRIGVFSIGDLAECPEGSLKKYFGVYGPALKKTARGESSAKVTPPDRGEDEKSIGNEHTFYCDIGDLNRVYGMLLYLSQKVGRRARRKGFAGRTVTLKLRYADFETHTHRETFPQVVWDDRDIFDAAKMLFLQIYKKHKKVRLVGVSISGLVRIESNHCDPLHQIDFFNETKRERTYLPVLDGLRDKFGEHIISRAAAKRK